MVPLRYEGTAIINRPMDIELYTCTQQICVLLATRASLTAQCYAPSILLSKLVEFELDSQQTSQPITKGCCSLCIPRGASVVGGEVMFYFYFQGECSLQTSYTQYQYK